MNSLRSIILFAMFMSGCLGVQGQHHRHGYNQPNAVDDAVATVGLFENLLNLFHHRPSIVGRLVFVLETLVEYHVPSEIAFHTISGTDGARIIELYQDLIDRHYLPPETLLDPNPAFNGVFKDSDDLGYESYLEDELDRPNYRVHVPHRIEATAARRVQPPSRMRRQTSKKYDGRFTETSRLLTTGLFTSEGIEELDKLVLSRDPLSKSDELLDQCTLMTPQANMLNEIIVHYNAFILADRLNQRRPEAQHPPGSHILDDEAVLGKNLFKWAVDTYDNGQVVPAYSVLKLSIAMHAVSIASPYKELRVAARGIAAKSITELDSNRQSVFEGIMLSLFLRRQYEKLVDRNKPDAASLVQKYLDIPTMWDGMLSGDKAMIQSIKRFLNQIVRPEYIGAVHIQADKYFKKSVPLQFHMFLTQIFSHIDIAMGRDIPDMRLSDFLHWVDVLWKRIRQIMRGSPDYELKMMKKIVDLKRPRM